MRADGCSSLMFVMAHDAADVRYTRHRTDAVCSPCPVSGSCAKGSLPLSSATISEASWREAGDVAVTPARGDTCTKQLTLPLWSRAGLRGGGGSRGLLFLCGALDSHPVFPSHVASGRCVLSAAAAGAPAGVVSAFAEPSGWCAGPVLNAAWCAICASAAPNSWRIEDVLVVAGVV